MMGTDRPGDGEDAQMAGASGGKRAQEGGSGSAPQKASWDGSIGNGTS